MKNPNWKQNTPVDQLVTLLMSLEGHKDNWECDLITESYFKEKVTDHINQMFQLLPFIQGKESWQTIPS
jgi:hypothetical protein